ncbi:MAG TPA: hypothetical protein VGA51_02070 [Casimicrobiaceae bacterium]
MIQCTLFDTQSYAGFEERAKRVERMSREHNERRSRCSAWLRA